MNDRTTRRDFLRTAGVAGAGVIGGGSLAAAAEQCALAGEAPGADKRFRAGAAAVDVSPRELPVLCSGGFLERVGQRVNDPLFARALVLDDGSTKVVICVVDILMMRREMLDGVKEKASAATGIPSEHILISATHTHAAPSVMGALGTGVDEVYAAQLPPQIVEAISRAAENLAPARVGWAAVDDPEDTNCRVWIRRPDRIGTDPFGERTIRAMMHPGYQNPDYIGPAGPEDPALTVLSVQSTDGRPIALVANYSMHYFGSGPISADYFGRFVEKIKVLLGAEKAGPPFVAMMSQGTSGDQHWMDYSRPRKAIDLDTYAERVARRAFEAYRTIEHHDWVPLAMAEGKLRLKRRLPDEKRLAWAKGIIEAMGDRTKPQSQPEVYGFEQLYLVAEPERELKLQAVRIGELGITAIPNEVYAITGLKLKRQSPFPVTMNIELAGGGEGYIPPPEQHPLGGYNTWPARSAGLEVTAEPKITEAVLGLLEKVASRPRRKTVDRHSPYDEGVLALKPMAYWKLREIQGRRANDSTGEQPGRYEDGVVFYLPGPAGAGFACEGQDSRAAHFAGGRMKANLAKLGGTYSVAMWFWNGLPADARAVTGYLFSRGADGAADAPGDHLGIGGTHEDTAAGKLFFANGNALGETLVGKTEVPLKTWCQVVLVRDGTKVTVYLNGSQTPEIAGEAAVGYPPNVGQIFLGGRNDNLFNFEGKLCNVAIFNRALSAEEVTKLCGKSVRE